MSFLKNLFTATDTLSVEIPVSADVTGATTLVVQFSKNHFATISGTLDNVDPDGAGAAVAAVTRKDATTIRVAVPTGSKANYFDSKYRVLRNGVVIGTGQLLNYRTAAKAARRRK